MNSTDKGQRGEALAVAHLIKNDYQIKAQNFRYRKAEIDIIAQKDNVLAIIEVKWRSSTYFGNPEIFVTQRKQALLVMAAHHYVTSNNLEVEVRFDIISIKRHKKLDILQHIENAYYFF